jgi:hypothetical protein
MPGTVLHQRKLTLLLRNPFYSIAGTFAAYFGSCKLL